MALSANPETRDLGIAIAIPDSVVVGHFLTLGTFGHAARDIVLVVSVRACVRPMKRNASARSQRVRFAISQLPRIIAISPARPASRILPLHHCRAIFQS